MAFISSKIRSWRPMDFALEGPPIILEPCLLGEDDANRTAVLTLGKASLTLLLLRVP